MKTEYDQALELIESNDLEGLEKHVESFPELVCIVEDGATLLNHAAAANSMECVELLLEKGAPADGPFLCKSTPLHWAASLDLKEICEKLIEAGASLSVTDEGGKGGTPLVQALFYGHSETADYLADFEITPRNLRVTAGLGRIDLMEKFFYFNGKLKKQAGKEREWYRANDEFPEKPTTNSDQEILDEALCYACFNNRMEAVEFLIEKGAEPNNKPFYATALHFAVAKDNIEMVDFLLEKGADPLIVDDNYKSTPFGWAEWGRSEKMMQHLLSVMEDVDLYFAVQSGKVDKVKSLIQSTKRSALEGEKGKRSLIKAIEMEAFEIEQLLRDSGAKLCLGSACSIGAKKDVELLIGQGIRPNSTMTVSALQPGSHSQEKEIPVLLLAAINQNFEICNMLIEAGAKLDVYSAAALNMVSELTEFLKDEDDIDREDELGRTPLHRAIQGDAFETVQYLIQEGADIHKTADFFSCGPTAIHIAAESGASESVINLLLEKGCDLNEDCNIGTPLDCALRAEQEETAEYLVSKGAISTEDK